MRKDDFYLTLFFAVILMIGGIWFVASSGSLSGFLKEVQHQRVSVRYFCPRHTEVGFDRPGSCPVCKAQLLKYTSNKGAEGD